MPTPNKGEKRDHFISRCMSDPESKQSFPNNDQRLAVCESKWENRNKVDISSEDLAADGGLATPDGNDSMCGPGYKLNADGICVPVSKRALDLGPAGLSMVRLRAMALVPIAQPCPSCGNVHRVDQQPLKNRQSPGHEDPFLKDELTMARALDNRAETQSAKVKKLYDPILSDATKFNENDFNDATEEAQRTWQDTWDEATEAAVAVALAASLSSGERQVSAGILSGTPSRQAVLDGMVQASKFYTNEFFNTQVMPELQRRVADILDGTPAMEAPDIGAIRAVLDRRLKSVPYWRVVANAATSRSYHYGLLKAAQFQGRRTYVYTAVLDERTTEICRELDGRSWFIADAVDLVERVASTDDPEEVKHLTPWLKLEDVQGKSNDALRALGVIVPPVHGNCRSTIVVQ